MGLFDIFKQKNETSDTSEQTRTEVMVNTEHLSTEELLEKTVKDSSYKSSLYNRILTEELIVISANVAISDTYQYLEAGTSVELYSLPGGNIPLFTSIDRIFDNGIVKEDVEFLKMSGADLFSLATGETFVVNPYSEYKKKITPSEVNDLLDGYY